MSHQAINRLEEICNIFPAKLYEISEADFSAKLHPEKWSKKEILGHLIDSATNNHQRFVRAQFEDTPVIRYDQVNWNRYSHYQQMDTSQIITFWEAYNKHLVQLLRTIPEAHWIRLVNNGSLHPVSLGFVIEDYVVHLEHHLKQIFSQDIPVFS